MCPTVALTEPAQSSDEMPTGLASWLRCSSDSQARAARHTINSWYASFPDQQEKLLGRIRSDEDTNVLQAIDELHVHHLFASSCHMSYEEGKRSPDFRLYQASEYRAGVEVCTLFPDQPFTSEVLRNDRLVGEINKRVRSTHWYLALNAARIARQPSFTDIGRWLQSTMDALSIPMKKLGREDYPTAKYVNQGVELEVTFIPRYTTTNSAPTESVVAMGPPVFNHPESDRRLRNALSKKAGDRYDHRGTAFAIFVVVRDYAGTEDLINALYGDEAIVFDINNPGSARSSRRNNGFFAKNKGNPEGRNRRVSCVFAIPRGWSPTSGATPSTQVLRFDNPFAYHSFPNSLIALEGRFAAQGNANGIRMDWAT